ncbi:MAG: hypothetical protein ACD_76C00068G0025 [uncultured bacterium]|nr:MAG: hypothetical protein ACD_76C00068G0025 [uncultured bacterium]
MNNGRPNFPKLEEEILAFWKKESIFQKTLEKDSPKGRFVFFEGPPTANGRPGIHHVEARSYKDLIPRYKTMCGYHVARKAGWDTQGLPVELEVEKQLGFHSKQDIEKFGIAAFNEACKRSVWKYLDDWVKLTERIGFWLDMQDAYITYMPEYIESLWWFIKQVWDKGLIYKDYKIVPYCPRCGTSLSSHELAQGYKDVEEESVFVKFRIKGEKNTALLAWTTTPWTLPSNVALAVHPEIIYAKVKQADESFWMAKDLITSVAVGDYEITEEKKGSELAGIEYEPLYSFVQYDKKAHYVVPADFVSTADGTGIVHTAVMYGADDFELGTKLDLPKYHLVGENGRFKEQAGEFADLFVKEADPKIIEDLKARGLMYKTMMYKHSYPFCWRCKTPLLYYAKDSWYIKMSQMRDKLLAENSKIHWEPEYIKEGRFGEWLREVKDWAISRERYWGTPLPIWECEKCKDRICIGSMAELAELSGKDLGESFDPHRPYVDDVTIPCNCGGTRKRIPEVADVWFDSGCMQFAQWHYPFENKEKIDSGEAYPADYISEAIDQTRGWFYTLLAVSTLLSKEAPFRNVICLGHVLDEKGKKMSKSLGNIIDPWNMVNTYGADSVRWYFYSVNQPGDPKRFAETDLQELIKKVFLILWNVKTFYLMFADKRDGSWNKKPTHALDMWILSRLSGVAQDVTKNLDSYKVTESARAIAEFINDLSVWYVRRSRDRFKTSQGDDLQSAIWTLRTVLINLAKIMAPFTPFFAESLYQDIGGEKLSVHLEDWPDLSEFRSEATENKMAKVRSIVSRALERRSEAGRPVRQALASLTITTPDAVLDDVFAEIIKDEVNVKQVILEKGEDAIELDTVLTPELIRDGIAREIIRRANAMRKEARMTLDDRISLYAFSASHEVEQAMEEHKGEIMSGTQSNEILFEKQETEFESEFKTAECEIWIGCKKNGTI